MKLKEYFKQLKVDLKPMTFTQKVDHIWTYNKELILITVGVLVLVISFLVTFLSKPEPIFSGYLLNVEISEDGKTYLSEGFQQHCGATGKNISELNSGMYNLDLSSAYEASYSTRMQVAALCSGQFLDYMIMDKKGMEAFIVDEVYMDLRDFFTEEEFAQWKDKITYLQPEGGTEYPAVIDISDLAFVKDCIDTDEPVYLVFIVNTTRPERCTEFWNYLLSWE